MLLWRLHQGEKAEKMKYRIVSHGKVVAVVDTPTLIDGKFPEDTPVLITPFGAEILRVNQREKLFLKACPE